MNNQIKPEVDGQRIRALREQRGLSADGLAHRTGITARHILRMERGNLPNTRAVTLARIAIGLSSTVEYLLGLSDDPAFYRAEQPDVPG
jgi:transcriptional regulator with XRE-family HTH domain